MPEEFKSGDIVKILPNAVDFNGNQITSWVKNLPWTVDRVAKNRILLGVSADKHYTLNVPIDAKYLKKLD